MKKVTSILSMLLLCFTAFSQSNSETEQKREQIEIRFDQDSHVVDSKWGDNEENLKKLAKLIDELKADSLITISQIQVSSYTSPEGGRSYNKKLSQKRSASLYDYLTKTISIPDSLIVRNDAGIDWDGLETLVSESDMQYKDKVLSILRNVPEETWRRVEPNDRWLTLVDSRNKHLMDLNYGRAYNYMDEVIFPKLRRGLVVTIYYKMILPPIKKNFELKEQVDTVVVEEPKPQTEPKVEPKAEPVVVDSADAEKDQKSLKFAFKTNLLYDLIAAPNIELEISIGKRWSVAGEWMFPWWVTKSNGNALEVLSGQVEGRYWFGDRTNRPQLTGWFAGLYAGGGLYDLQLKNNGYQGEFYIAAGLAGGYAHTINKKGNLRMEYSLGLGYLSTDYQYYQGKQDNEYLVWQYDGRYSWLGPTKAEVSLVWFIDWKMGGKR